MKKIEIKPMSFNQTQIPSDSGNNSIVVRNIDRGWTREVEQIVRTPRFKWVGNIPKKFRPSFLYHRAYLEIIYISKANAYFESPIATSIAKYNSSDIDRMAKQLFHEMDVIGKRPDEKDDNNAGT